MAKIIDIAREPQAALTEGCAALAAGEPIAMPTETVYGLAADATNASAIARIYETKGRPRFNPLIAHMSDMAMAERHALFDLMSLRLARAFWPGPLTLVLPKRPDSTIDPLAAAGLETIAVRVPEGFANRLIGAFGKPVAAPSANTSGRISPTTAAHVEADLGGKIGLILDGGAAGVGVESTIVKIEDGIAYLLRPGGLSASAIESCLGQKLVRIEAGGDSKIEAPGMLLSHYAPAAGVRMDAASVAPDEILINFGDQTIAGADSAVARFDLSPRGDLREAAANLFSMMKQADALDARAIAFAPIPDRELGEAINDRLRRAAAPRPGENHAA